MAAERESVNKFSFSKQFKSSETIKIKTANNEAEGKDSILYQINVVPDAYPQISFKERHDSTNSKLLYFVGDINDDYGFTKLLFHYKYIETNNPAKKQQGIKPSY